MSYSEKLILIAENEKYIHDHIKEIISLQEQYINGEREKDITIYLVRNATPVSPSKTYEVVVKKFSTWEEIIEQDYNGIISEVGLYINGNRVEVPGGTFQTMDQPRICLADDIVEHDGSKYYISEEFDL